jgi:hypothetical protein
LPRSPLSLPKNQALGWITDRGKLLLYTKFDATQRTNQRLNEKLKKESESVPHIDVYTALPPDFALNGLPVHGSVGLELGLIKTYYLPWNLRSFR